jgi:hypothetical protein
MDTPVPDRSPTTLTPGAAPGFGRPVERPGVPLAAWGVAALIVLAVAAGLIFLGRGKPVVAPNTLLAADPSAAELPLTDLAMSESTSLSGGKLTYLDGHIRNATSRTLQAATVQVVFQNDDALPPQVETLSLSLIRMRQPYIDTEAVSAEPIKPGEDREFRLIFETVPANWNTQMPEVRIIHATLR